MTCVAILRILKFDPCPSEHEMENGDRFSSPDTMRCYLYSRCDFRLVMGKAKFFCRDNKNGNVKDTMAIKEVG